MAAVTDAEAAQFRETGVLLKPNFFSTEEARAMKAAVEELRSAGHMTDIHFNDQHENLQMPWMSHHQRLFQLLPWEARTVEAVERLLEAEQGIEVHYDQLFYKPALTGSGTSWHTDNGYFQIRDPLKGLGMWIACDDASAANGTLHVAPWRPSDPEIPHMRD